MPNGPTGMPKAVKHLIDLGHACAFLQQQVSLAHVVSEHAVGDETEAIADHNAHFVQLLRQFRELAMVSLLESRPRTISMSFITLAGLKKWWPMTLPGRPLA